MKQILMKVHFSADSGLDRLYLLEVSNLGGTKVDWGHNKKNIF